MKALSNVLARTRAAGLEPTPATVGYPGALLAALTTGAFTPNAAASANAMPPFTNKIII